MSILDQGKAEETPLAKENPGTLFLIAMAGLLFWIVTPPVYLRVVGHVPLSDAKEVHFSPHDLSVIGILMPMVGLVALVVGNVLYRDRPFERIGFGRITARTLRAAAIAIVIILPVTLVASFGTEWFWQLIHYTHPVEHDVLRAMAEDHSIATRAALIVSAVICAPLFEEFMFRGMLQSAALAALAPAGRRPPKLARWTAIVFASILFTAVHGQLWMMPPIFVLSLCLGYAYDRTGNLWVPILVHAAFNSVEVILYLYSHH